MKTLLLLTRGAMEACFGANLDVSFAVSADLDTFSDVVALDRVPRLEGLDVRN